MRGIYTSVNEIRKQVFAEIAKLSYEYEEGCEMRLEQIPYDIIKGEATGYRESVFLERAIVEERLRLAMGLPLRPVAEHAPVSKGAEECIIPEKYYQPPLINIIKFACHKCPDNVIKVTEDGEFYVWSKDNVGNVTMAEETVIVDTTAPTITLSYLSQTITVGMPLEANIITNEDAIISYSWDNENWVDSTELLTSLKVSKKSTTTGKYALYAKAKDNNGL